MFEARAISRDMSSPELPGVAVARLLRLLAEAQDASDRRRERVLGHRLVAVLHSDDDLPGADGGDPESLTPGG